MNKDTSNTIICINGEKYAFDLEKIKEVCLTSDKEKAQERELIDNFESNEDGGLDLTSRISREVKSAGNPQNDSIVYDVVKLFISSLLSSTLTTNSPLSEMNFATALSFNTMIEAGILYKI